MSATVAATRPRRFVRVVVVRTDGQADLLDLLLDAYEPLSVSGLVAALRRPERYVRRDLETLERSGLVERVSGQAKVGLWVAT